MHNTSLAEKKEKGLHMTYIYVLYSPGLALLRVMLLLTWFLWTTENLLFHLLSLWKDSHNDRSYT
jgi:hypothetical protein